MKCSYESAATVAIGCRKKATTNEVNMKTTLRSPFLLLAISCLVLFGSIFSVAQVKKTAPQREFIEATATGTSTKLGKMVSVTITIYDYSPPEDQKVLLEAFENSGNQGLVNALSKMSAKGRIAIPGTLGFDLNYIRKFKTPQGLKIRFVTDRPITFGEAWSGSRSMEYNLSAGEINISDVKDKSAGTLAPACQFKVDKKTQELQLEMFKDPWNLINIRYTR